jgi:hypothetical protein
MEIQYQELHLRIQKDNMLIHIVSIWMQKLPEKTVDCIFSNVTTDNDMTEK